METERANKVGSADEFVNECGESEGETGCVVDVISSKDATWLAGRLMNSRKGKRRKEGVELNGRESYIIYWYIARYTIRHDSPQYSAIGVQYTAPNGQSNNPPRTNVPIRSANPSSIYKSQFTHPHHHHHHQKSSSMQSSVPRPLLHLLHRLLPASPFH